jgi:hypothetical protein
MLLAQKTWGTTTLLLTLSLLIALVPRTSVRLHLWLNLRLTLSLLIALVPRTCVRLHLRLKLRLTLGLGSDRRTSRKVQLRRRRQVPQIAQGDGMLCHD